MSEQVNQTEMTQDAEDAKKRKVKYKIDWKKLGLLVGALVVVVGVIGGGVWFFKNKFGGEKKIYDVAIQLRDQKNSDPKEDLRSSLKAGDVILARETGREWSTTERISYLIIKMKLNEDQLQKIVKPKTEELSKKEGIKKGILTEESAKEMEREELKQVLTETVVAREYRVKIEDMGFDIMKVREAQPFPDEEFTWKIVEKK